MKSLTRRVKPSRPMRSCSSHSYREKPALVVKLLDYTSSVPSQTPTPPSYPLAGTVESTLGVPTHRRAPRRRACQCVHTRAPVAKPASTHCRERSEFEERRQPPYPVFDDHFIPIFSRKEGGWSDLWYSNAQPQAMSHRVRWVVGLQVMGIDEARQKLKQC